MPTKPVRLIATYVNCTQSQQDWAGSEWHSVCTEYLAGDGNKARFKIYLIHSVSF